MTAEVARGLSFWPALTAAQQLELTMALQRAREGGMDWMRELAAMSDEELRAAIRGDQ